MIGRARLRARLEREEPVPDGGGGYAPGWTTVATIWIAILPIAGREVTAGGGLGGATRHRVLIRRRLDVTPAMRLVIGARTFNIRAVLDREPASPWLELACEEGVAT
ncbi:MAG: phage head closure protein [Alphaproteobacteria bacterium]